MHSAPQVVVITEDVEAETARIAQLYSVSHTEHLG